MITQQFSLLAEPMIKRVKTPPKKRDYSNSTCVATILHFGGGQDSGTIEKMITTGNMPKPTVAVFCDTHDEPRWVYDQVEESKQRLEAIGVPFVITERSQGGIIRDSMDNHRMANTPLYVVDSDGNRAILKRQCTDEYKVQPSNSIILNMLIQAGHAKIITDKNGKRSRRVNKSVHVESWFGIALDEFYRAGNRGAQWQKAVYPLIDRRMSKSDCVRWLNQHGFKPYKKSACLHCTFRDDESWLFLSINDPIAFEQACAYDEWLRSPDAMKRRWRTVIRGTPYLHSSCKPLRLVDFEQRIAAKQPQPELCGQYCMN